MGRGNFYLEDDEGRGYPMVFIDEEELEDYESPSAIIGEFLPDSFYLPDVNRRSHRNERGFCGTAGENGLVTVSLFDNQNSYAIVVSPKEEHVRDWEYGATQTLNLAKRYMYEFAEKFFNKLSERFELRIRTSAWTSGLYVPTNRKENEQDNS